VSKQIYVVGGIGVAGCLMLSFMMQHLLKVKTDRTRSPIAAELEETCAGHLDGRVEASTLEVDGDRTLLVRLKIRTGVDGEALARSVGDLIWRHAYELTETPERLRLEVRGSAYPTPLVVDSRPPGLLRLQKGHGPDPVRPPQSSAGSAQPPK
jgi:hypothetical protein